MDGQCSCDGASAFDGGRLLFTAMRKRPKDSTVNTWNVFCEAIRVKHDAPACQLGHWPTSAPSSSCNASPSSDSRRTKHPAWQDQIGNPKPNSHHSPPPQTEVIPSTIEILQQHIGKDLTPVRKQKTPRFSKLFLESCRYQSTLPFSASEA